jgi:hypothetical protein
LLEQKARLPVVVDGVGAKRIIGCSDSKLANLTREGQVPSFLDGAKRLWPTGPLIDYLISKVVESIPLNGPPKKARHPVGQFRKGHTPPPRTAAQREALAEGNRLRIQRARARSRKTAKETVAST